MESLEWDASPERDELFHGFFRLRMYDGRTMLTLTRIAVSLAAATLAPTLLGQAASTSAEVVFVCEHGAAKSVIAAAHFNHIARQRGLNLRAVARGANPDPEIAPKVVAGLKSEGLKEITAKPQLVSERDTSDAKRVVTLGCKLPYKAQSTDWNDIPSPSADYPAASSAIRTRVEALLAELAAAEPAPNKNAK
jgi:arsenate reductase (thioredoxin)